MFPRAGFIYLVRDDEVAMPPEAHRTHHDQRTVLVVSGNDHNANDRWPIVLMCPVSSGPLSSTHDVRLGAGIGGLKVKGWARVALVQPFEKTRLGDLLSVTPVPAALMQDIYASLFKYMQPNI